MLRAWKPKPRTSLVRRLRRLAAAQLLDEQRQAVGEAVDVKTSRIVVAVADIGVDGGMECRNEPVAGGGKCRPEPVAGADAGDGVEQRQPVVLRGGEARARRLRVVMAAVSRRGSARGGDLPR